MNERSRTLRLVTRERPEPREPSPEEAHLEPVQENNKDLEDRAGQAETPPALLALSDAQLQALVQEEERKAARATLEARYLQLTALKDILTPSTLQVEAIGPYLGLLAAGIPKPRSPHVFTRQGRAD